MKKILFALCLVPSLALAKPVSFDFAAVSLVTFGQATFKSIMNRDYVVSPEVVALDRKITISVKNIDSADVPRFVENLLLQQGITTTLKDGVYYLTATTQQGAIQDRQSLPAEPVRPSSYDPSIKAPEARNLPQGGILDAHSAAQSVAGGGSVRRPDDESIVYRPLNRKTDFMAEIISASFGRIAATVAGSSLVLTGSKSELEKMRALLDALDTLPKLVDVSASWVEVTENNGSSRGISVIANVLGVKLGATLGTVNSGSAISLKNTNFELVIDALNTDSRFKQV